MTVNIRKKDNTIFGIENTYVFMAIVAMAVLFAIAVHMYFIVKYI